MSGLFGDKKKPAWAGLNRGGITWLISL